MSLLKKINEWLTPAKPKTPKATALYILDDGHPAAEIQTRYGAIISIYKGADQWWNMTPDLKELQERRADPDKPVEKTPCTAEEAIAAAHKIDERIKQSIKNDWITDHDPLGRDAGYYILGKHYFGERRALDAYTDYLRKGIDPRIIVKLRIFGAWSPDPEWGYGIISHPDRPDGEDETEQGDFKDREIIRQRLADRYFMQCKQGKNRQDRYTPEEVFQMQE